MFTSPPEGHTVPGPLRVLCLGNDMLADDAFGPVVAAAVQAKFPGVEVVVSPASGFGLLDDLLNTTRLIVVDSVQSGGAPPGTVYCLREEDLQCPVGGSAHYVGLFEMLALARALQLSVPRDVVILAVETADCITVGGAMDPVVQEAVPLVVGQVGAFIQGERRAA